MILRSVGSCQSFSLVIIFTLVLAVVTSFSTTVEAQRVILNETFESDAPDTFPNSADFFARSSIAPDPMLDPSTAVVTGGTFADPFNPGSNQSLLLHNPDGTTQMAVTWTDEFDDDPSVFRNGSIEYDMWMENPDPNAFWTYIAARIGYGDSERSGVTGAASDTTVWNTFRLQNLEEPEPVESITDPGYGITAGLETTFTDNGDDLMGPDRSVHVKFEFEESSTSGGTFHGFPVYRIIVSDTTIEWLQDTEVEHPWVFDAGAGGFVPGINILSFLTDASAHGLDPDPGTGNVYIDNLLVINNDLSPVNADFNNNNFVDGGDFLIWQKGLGIGTTHAEGDADGNGVVDELDLGIWENDFGSASPAVSSVVIPEPSTATIAILLALIPAMSRRRYVS